jgi:hypothetical protein
MADQRANRGMAEFVGSVPHIEADSAAAAKES